MTNQNVQTNRHEPQNKGCNQASADSKHYLVSKLRLPCPLAWTKEISAEAYVRDLGSTTEKCWNGFTETVNRHWEKQGLSFSRVFRKSFFFFEFSSNHSFSAHARHLNETTCRVLWLKVSLGLRLIWANSIFLSYRFCWSLRGCSGSPEALLFA